MAELQKFMDLVEVESRITEVFSQKLDILDFIKNKFTSTEYQQCIASLTSTVEKIIKQKDQETKQKLYQDLKNPVNYTFERQKINVCINSSKDYPIYDTILKHYPNSERMLEECANLKSPGYYGSAYRIHQDQDQYSNLKEIIIIFERPTYCLTTSDPIKKIMINVDYLDKYLNLLYITFKYLNPDDTIIIDFYKIEDNIFLIFNVSFKRYYFFIDMKSENDEQFFINKYNKGRELYTKNNFKKLCIDGINMFKVFCNSTDKPMIMTLNIVYDNVPLKYIKYNGKIYSLDIDKIFEK